MTIECTGIDECTHCTKCTSAQRADFSSDGSCTNPPLGILICQSKLRFIFFPFISNDGPCIDAIVTESIELFNGHMILESWFVFTCFYIESIFGSDLKLIEENKLKIKLHPKKVYSVYIETDQDIEKERDSLLSYICICEDTCRY